jgi:hypothetical protein
MGYGHVGQIKNKGLKILVIMDKNVHIKQIKIVKISNV